ncbi:unnamed protein product [Linum tenue]|uniref:CCHC-type domain-containing protein n=1 Tax=Linum tenue TaxID=586396 RepID=A0AAV0MT04_9ROSI|nr:unnamed protein product [Linum tenue]
MAAALVNQGVKEVRWLERLLQTQDHGPPTNPRIETTAAHHAPPCIKERSKSWTRRGDRDRGFRKRTRSPAQDPLHPDVAIKRRRLCKSPGWCFYLPSPEETEEVAEIDPESKGHKQSGQVNSEADHDRNALRTQNETKTFCIQAWRFKIPTAEDLDGDKEASCPGGEIFETEIALSGLSDFVVPGFRSRNGAKPRSFSDVDDRKVAPAGSFPVLSMARITNDQVVEFSLEEVQATRVRRSRMLIGRLFSDERLSTAELRDAVNRPWQGQGRIIVRNLAHDLFEFTLPSETSKAWVLQRTPWIVADRILHVQAWIPSVSHRTFEDLAVVPFRVQLWDVQEDCCTHQFGRKIVSSMIGRVLETGVFASSDMTQKFVKVKTLVDFSKPLRSQIMATNAETGRFWIRFKYEFLPTFCFRCGRVGHARQTCQFDPPTRKERFGPHMTTKEMGVKIFEGEETHHQGPRLHKSVWVNTENRGPQGPRTGSGLGARKIGPSRSQARGPEDAAAKSQGEGQARYPSHASPAQPQGRSPKVFSVAKGPKLALGRRGKSKPGPGPSPMEMDGADKMRWDCEGAAEEKADQPRKKRGPIRRQRDKTPNKGKAPIQKTEGKVRIRRLILEEESEEEFFLSEIPDSLHSIGPENSGKSYRAGPRDCEVLDVLPLQQIPPAQAGDANGEQGVGVNGAGMTEGSRMLSPREVIRRRKGKDRVEDVSEVEPVGLGSAGDASTGTTSEEEGPHQYSNSGLLLAKLKYASILQQASVANFEYLFTSVHTERGLLRAQTKVDENVPVSMARIMLYSCLSVP